MDQLEAAATVKVRDYSDFHQAGAVEAGEKADSGNVWGGKIDLPLAWVWWVREKRGQGACP